MTLSDIDKEWLTAMLKDREQNRRLYDALASEHLPDKIRMDKAAGKH